MLQNSTDDRHMGLQSLLYLPSTQSDEVNIRAIKNDRSDLFTYLLRLRVVDKLFAPRPAEHSGADLVEDKMPTHVRATQLKSSCRVCIYFVMRNRSLTGTFVRSNFVQKWTTGSLWYAMLIALLQFGIPIYPPLMGPLPLVYRFLKSLLVWKSCIHWPVAHPWQLFEISASILTLRRCICSNFYLRPRLIWRFLKKSLITTRWLI